MERLKRRQDFVAAARARYAATPGMVVQMRACGDDEPVRVGFTATKRIGNAVVRNRVKRRLRELARLRLESQAWRGHDYVLIGRDKSFGRSFPDLESDLAAALKKLHRTAPARGDRGTP